jgi:hypothetical protein
MFKSSAGKIFFGFLLLFNSACSLWQNNQNATPNPTPFVPTEIKSEIPFSTREPDVYQAEIINRTFVGGNENTNRKIFVARKGESRLTIFNQGEKRETAILNSSAGAAFSLYHSRKIYTENLANSDSLIQGGNDFLTTEWLNQKTSAAFENLGAENGLSKFRVKLGDAETTNSEILIFVDENIKLPVRQEFYSVTGEQRTLVSSVELKNFKSEADEKLFEMPKDYRKVSAKEFQEIIWQERNKE